MNGLHVPFAPKHQAPRADEAFLVSRADRHNVNFRDEAQWPYQPGEVCIRTQLANPRRVRAHDLADFGKCTPCALEGRIP